MPFLRQSEAVKNGAAAGVLLSILTWLINLVLIFLLGLLTLGLAWTGILGCVVCGPVDLTTAAIAGMLGASLFEKFWR